MNGQVAVWEKALLSAYWHKMTAPKFYIFGCIFGHLASRLYNERLHDVHFK